MRKYGEKMKILLAYYPYININYKGGDYQVLKYLYIYLSSLGYQVEWSSYRRKFNFSNKILNKIFGKIETAFLPIFYGHYLNNLKYVDLVISDSLLSIFSKHKTINIHHINYRDYWRKVKKNKIFSIQLYISIIWQYFAIKKNINVAVSRNLFRILKKQGAKNLIQINNIVAQYFENYINKFNNERIGYFCASNTDYFGKGLDILSKLGEKGYNIDCYTNANIPYVNCISPVPNEQCPYLYSKYRILIFPSRYESFGLVPLEALALSIPVIMRETGIGYDLKKIIPEFVVENGENIDEYIERIKIIESKYDEFCNKAKMFYLSFAKRREILKMWNDLIESLAFK